MAIGEFENEYFSNSLRNVLKIFKIHTNKI